MTSATRRSVILVVFSLALTVAGCASAPVPNPRAESFTRTSLLVEAIDEALESENLIRTVNLLTYGRERDLLADGQIASYLEAVAVKELEAYGSAREELDFQRAIRSEQNLHRLAQDTYELGVSVDLTGVESRDQLLLQWSNLQREEDEDVLALYLLLRRSTLGDLASDDLVEYAAIARRLNHDEALHRLRRVAEQRGEPLPGAEADQARRGDPAEMLAGTVTVWVNRGIRVERGVGVPDRVVGSGFFVDPRGYLLTNYHVISSEVDPEYEGYSRLFIKLPGRPDERVPARVVGYDRVFDLALLKVELDPDYVFSLSDTRELRPGEAVLALGSPGGLDSSVTSGIVSAAGRRFLQMGEAVQVDVPINPGNSGGPLVLPDGQVAGVVFAGIEQFEGVNFAIPAYWVRHFFPQLFMTGEVVHAWIGTALFRGDQGLEVIYVAPESPADRAGVRPGDVLTQINDRPVTTMAVAQDQLLALDPGSIIDTVWIPASDEAGPVATRRRLIAVDERPFSPVENALERQPIEALFPVLFGMDVDPISSAPWGPDFVITGVFPGSIADESSLSVDDPFALRDWRVDRDLRAAFIRIEIKKRKAGFLESGVQLGAFLETDSFL